MQPSLPPAILPEVIQDPQHEARVRYAIRAFLEGTQPDRIAHAIAATFGVTREQARLDVESMKDFTAREMDDEANVGFFMLRKVASFERIASVLEADATAPIPTTETVTGSDGMGEEVAISPQGAAMLKSARVQAAKAFVDVSRASLDIVKRRSVRFGDKPVVNVNIGAEGVTAAQAEFIARLNGD